MSVLVGGALMAAGLPAATAAPDPGTPAATILHAGRPGSIAGSYIVVLKDSAANVAATDLTARHGGAVRLRYSAALRGFSVRATESQAKQIAADPAVSYVEQDSLAHIADTQPNPPSYGLDRIDQRDLPLDNSYTFPNRAAGVHAYIVDTGGRFTHTEFGGRLKSGRDFIDNDDDATDCNGHGTHVSGTVGSATYGVAKGIDLTSVRVLDCNGSGPFSGVIAGIDWVVQNGARPAVINMSLSGGATTSVDDAVARATQAGVHVVVAAGNNNGGDACQFSPARAPSAITVGASDRNDARAGFSNIGTCLDIFAPGVSILSTWFASDTATNTLSGTSMATPHVVGGLSLFLDANPNATPQQARDALVNAATQGKIGNPGTGSPNRLLFVGNGQPPPPSCDTRTNGTDVAIPDAGNPVTSPIDVTGCDGNAPANLAVRVDINHTYTGDLGIDLIAPSGAVHSLKKPGGIGAATGIHTSFTVNASAETRNGRWQLRVVDVFRFDTGVLDSWALGATAALTGPASTQPLSHAAPPTDELAPDQAGPALVNGTPTTVSEFPSIIAGLRVGSARPDGQSCTASVVAPRKVLTAAHCMVDVSGDKSYVYGRNDVADTSTGFKTRVVEFKTHPNYPGPGGWQTGWDVAIVTTADDIPVPSGQFARFATSADTALTAPGRSATTVGYGMKRPGDNTDGRLMKTTLPINDPSTCNVFDITVKPDFMVCAGFNDGRTGICSGDSGGPLIVDGIIVGLTSWGSSQCDRYSIFARLTNEMGDWAHGQLEPPGNGTFTVGVSPSSVQVAQPGGFISTTVTSTAGDGTPEPIELSASGLPSGGTAVFQPTTITAGDTAKLTFTTGTATPTGTFQITVSGKGSTQTKTATVTLTVGNGQPPSDLRVVLSPTSGSTFAGGTVFATVSVAGATAPATLTATGVPPGGRVQFLPSTVNPGQRSTMFAGTGFGTPSGRYTITVTATSNGTTARADFTLTVTR